MASPIHSIVVGAGALGVVYGSTLHQPNAPTPSLVSAVLRSEYDAIAARGGTFTIRSVGAKGKTLDKEWRPERIFRTAESASTANSGLVWDYVVVCAKFLPEVYATVDLISPLLTPNRTTVILIQNGLGIERDIAVRYPTVPVASASAYISAVRSEEEKGVTILKVDQGLPIGLYRGEDLPSGEYSIPPGAEEKVQLVVELWKTGGTRATYEPDNQPVRWAKLFVNAVYGPITILAGGLDTHEVLSSPGLRATVLAHHQELERAAELVLGKARFEAKVKSTGWYKSGEKSITDFQRLPAFHFSICTDFKLGNHIEVECILGEAVRQAKQRGCECPRLESTYEILRSAAGRRKAEKL
ncbi:hypothetical protein M427DRAFT_378471 [Gonapodya prolifera JEL478]|uniref:2-dehydropantoate 2-reductase n=1 Tax=Gonapodya prolifera (strain JEL478) TaxID=1344416 RepID=A0A139AV31_GONPJ|nr:hypothetical protein M427DRAFT_378471 [Gonapodya prolifera JEL478]|eukprot:KXS20567.1 hypothetical protein M427DRAFT_378471 [Gonapodya prolifera JEL478]